MNLDYKTIGKRVCRFRRGQNMTQEELAYQADVSSQYISHIETGKKKASLKILVSISKALCVSLDELIFGVELPFEEDGAVWEILLNDCSKYEKEVILDTMRTLKMALRSNKEKK